MRPVPALLVALAPLVLGGCRQHSCTLLGFFDQVVLSFEGAAWAPGQWTVRVEEESCTVTLPADEADIVCTGWLQLRLTGDGAGLEGAALQLVDTVPETLDVQLLHDGALVHREGVEPDYVVDEPNGEGCGERHQGTATLVVE